MMLAIIFLVQIFISVGHSNSLQPLMLSDFLNNYGLASGLVQFSCDKKCKCLPH